MHGVVKDENEKVAIAVPCHSAAKNTIKIAAMIWQANTAEPTDMIGFEGHFIIVKAKEFTLVKSP
jgi:hypothetical protein